MKKGKLGSYTKKRPAFFNLLIELGIALPIYLICLIFNQLVAKSFALGCLIYIVPNAYFTYYAFRYRGAELTQWIVRSFKWGQTGKLALVMAGFALVFRFTGDLNHLALFGGFIAMAVIQWPISAYYAHVFDHTDN